MLTEERINELEQPGGGEPFVPVATFMCGIATDQLPGQTDLTEIPGAMPG